MIFASDLDRTLIYSKKFIKEGNRQDVMEAEVKDGKVISYISSKTFQMLGKISRKVQFVPVTTRTMEQYKRIGILREIPHKYAIVANGGTIIEGGKEDEQWKSIVEKRLEGECLSLSEAMDRFKRISSPVWVEKTRTADDLFFYSIVDTQMVPMDELSDFEKEMDAGGWRMVHHSRKLYFIPKCVSKGDALLHISNKIDGLRDVISSGDSVLDIEMAGVSKYFISPLHAEIYKTMGDIAKDLNIAFTNQSGIESSEEILQFVENRISQK
ncbi:Hydroxymethylpyrimidine pyrophosphatase [Peptoclostridium litorale DSM 5388]|uniref:Sucrose phosphatase-like domain-containing protein n=1 Tax=Peptoclostridium litorale DSM 5388 TaxID=1121324 RepID=A0A069RHF7_PEPLI|nr:HAD family hydrolase [Peptoclostridium litorale]KDR96208.1 hypothetical protein CLIT_4c00450 [Peptoclostridium litorale DSM 5388]SIO13621.1 Hydroxymethylpyrimidine pyrophosphatase [Peptoclostridium litorale DSM 5388]